MTPSGTLATLDEMSKFSGKLTWVIATRNAHKVEEIRGILGNQHGYRTLADFPGAPAVIEDAITFAGNATKKAVMLARWIASRNFEIASADSGGAAAGHWVLADDSGLEVDALKGAPGVQSARFAALDSGEAGNSDDASNNAKLLRLLKDVPIEQRTARFRCVIAVAPILDCSALELASPACAADEIEVQVRLFQGTCEGRILLAPQGLAGFGYDPLFVPDGFEKSFAELRAEEKNRISHRSKALAGLNSAFQAELT